VVTVRRRNTKEEGVKRKAEKDTIREGA